MRWKIFLLVLIILLVIVSMVSAVEIERGMIIGFGVILAIVLTGTAYLMRSSEGIKSETENGKHEYEHHPDVRGTSLGCYGAEAEEEKFAYEQTPPQESHRKR